MPTRNSVFLTIFGDLHAIFTFFCRFKFAKKGHLARLYAQVQSANLYLMYIKILPSVTVIVRNRI